MAGTTRTGIRETWLGRHGVHAAKAAEEPCQSGVRVPVVAKKRVMIAEPRDTGKKKGNEQRRANTTAVSARKG